MWLLWVFLLLPVTAEANVVFNEIAWMGMPPKAGESANAAANNEWIELFNQGEETVSLGGWKITAADGIPGIILSGTISPNGFFLLERGSDDIVPSHVAGLVYPFKNALSNSGEHLFLRDDTGAVRDEINALSGWPAGDNQSKETMQRGGGLWKTFTATPGAPTPTPAPGSESLSSGAGLNSSSSTPLSPVSTARDFEFPDLQADAGENRVVAVGSETYFLAKAIDALGNPLDPARFWWNFGDGEAKEGRAVSHIFQIPGKYTVGLHVSSDIYAVSDYVLIEVIPNQIRISNVILGREGYIKLFNPSKTVLDIGGWVFEDDMGKKFTIPPLTKINSESSIALPNLTTGILQDSVSGLLSVFYSNGKPALGSSTPAANLLTVEAPDLSPASLSDTKVVEHKIEPQTEIKDTIISPGEKTNPAENQIVGVSKENRFLADTTGAANFLVGGKFFFLAALFLSMIGAILYFVVKKIIAAS